MQGVNLDLLRLKVLERYKNYSECARKMGWNPSKLNRIMRAEQALSGEDIEQLTENLDIKSCDQFLLIFFPQLVHKVDYPNA